MNENQKFKKRGTGDVKAKKRKCSYSEFLRF